MRLFTQKVFAGYITGGTTVYSLPEFDPLMGAAEKLAIEAVVSDWNSVAATLTVHTQWSNTGTIWVNRDSPAVINGVTLGNGTFQGVDTQTGGSLVRLAVTITSTATCNIALYVCGRAEQSWM